MGALADRLAYLAKKYGSDPSGWQPQLHALRSLEQSAPSEALARFHELKRLLAHTRRAELMHALRGFGFVEGVPATSTEGYEAKEVEADIRAAARAVAHARAIDAARREEARLRAGLRWRALPPAPPLARGRWDELARLAEEAEALRRAAAREAALDARIGEARRRAAKLQETHVAVPDLSAAAAPSPDEADARLRDVEARLQEAERLEEAYRASLAPLRAPDVAAYRRESKRAIEREAKELLERRDAAGLLALAPRSEALRAEAARLSSEAARARRHGRAPPAGERRPGDAMDPYA